MKFFAFAFICFTAAAAYETVQDENGQNYFLIPVEHLHRQRRQTSIGASGGGPGIRVTGTHQGNIFNSNGHRLDGAASVSKQFRPIGPTSVGGKLGYSHTPSGSNLNLGAQRTPGFGTDVSASGAANLWRNKNMRLDAVGNYDRHFGGVGGTGKPNYYGGLNFNGRF